MSLRDCITAARDGGELRPEDAARILRRFDELAEGGLSPENAKQRLIAEMEADAVGKFVLAFEQRLDQGTTTADAKAFVLAAVKSRDIRDQVAAKLDASVVLDEPPPHVLMPDQARQFAEALATGPTNREKIEALQRITGDKSIGMRTLKKVQHDLAERGLIDLRGGRKAAEPAAPKPEFDIPDMMKKQTRAAGKPVTGVFGANADLTWTGLPTGEFRANLRHIAEKRARKDDRAVYGDLSTPAKVEAHISEVLANPSFAQVRWLDGQPRELVILRMGSEGLDQVVGISLHRSDGTGRMNIATAYNIKREDVVKRLAAALNQQGVGAVKIRTAPDQLNELLTIVGEVPTADRGPAWNELSASLIREQAARRERATNAASGRHRAFMTASDENMRGLAVEAIGAGATVHVAPRIRDAVNRAAVDVLDIVPAGYRVGAIEKIEPITTPDGDAIVRATYRTAGREDVLARRRPGGVHRRRRAARPRREGDRSKRLWRPQPSCGQQCGPRSWQRRGARSGEGMRLRPALPSTSPCAAASSTRPFTPFGGTSMRFLKLGLRLIAIASACWTRPMSSGTLRFTSSRTGPWATPPTRSRSAINTKN